MPQPRSSNVFNPATPTLPAMPTTITRRLPHHRRPLARCTVRACRDSKESALGTSFTSEAGSNEAGDEEELPDPSPNPNSRP